MFDKNVWQLKVVVMWLVLVLSIWIGVIETFGDSEFGTNYESNKINKGIWVRNKLDGIRSQSHFFFPSTSSEREPLNSVGLQSFLGRDKRSAPSKSRKRHIKTPKRPATDQDSRASFFNDLPLGVAVLLENSNNKNLDYSGYPKYETKAPFDVKNETDILLQALDKIDLKDNHILEDDTFNYFKDIFNISDGNDTAKRSMKYDHMVVDRIDLLEMFNKSKDFNKEPHINKDQMWQTAPVPDRSLYEIIPKERNLDSDNPKLVNERGLVKVLSMLTRTFKKIMKQHNAIKLIHEQMNKISKDFEKKIELNTKKLNDFDVKYGNIMRVMDKLKAFQDCLNNKEEMYKNKEELMSKNLVDFENQQKKFLTQQQQFYNIQKLMLAQNEKVNAKQNSIAKMQNEISHRQNHFAKVLKKAKQAFHNKNITKLSPMHGWPKVDDFKSNTTKYESTITTVRTTSVAPVTIDLFSIAPNNVIEDHDQMILKEKDDKSVDDLIYKYYFNNTFIDTVIRNKLLGGIFVGDRTNIARNAKLDAKRNQLKIKKNTTETESTILLPVNNSEAETAYKRERRWIDHHSKKRHRKKNHSKGHSNDKTHNINKIIPKAPTTTVPVLSQKAKESDVIANNPFLAMATSFCVQIGQATTKQILDWCVEKSIRRLRTLDTKMIPPPPPPLAVSSPLMNKGIRKPAAVPGVSSYTPTLTKVRDVISSTPAQKTTKPSILLDQFFPDNEELESNLKQFDLTPDTAGNVYFEGSLHGSEMIGDKSDGVSDILPEINSNSKIDIDTRAIQLQLRRKYLQEKMVPETATKQSNTKKKQPKIVKTYS